ncbi:hypothetical protein [Sediminitomix flava]|uniref:Outer membrane protein beta-barrel domain-containing protein n=1 Tax=Sediminitomix flava TaxID=379075 RepID=A0A315Z8N8_SEDFL|nr:hypothetical protein [Sediminitomix flava]PWJ40925.1 Outer membrane protein beta-barrel domain-containing protein [Sediminitomix flava]
MTNKLINGIAIGCAFLFGIQNSRAQFSIGTAISYGDDIQEAGLQLKGQYLFKKPIAINAEYTTFAHHEEQTRTGSEDIKLREININIDRPFHLGSHFEIYPLAGINYSAEQEHFEGQNGIQSHSEHETVNHDEVIHSMGINLGCGMLYQFGHFSPFIEYAHLFSDMSQNNLSFGLLYSFGDHNGKQHSSTHHH